MWFDLEIFILFFKKHHWYDILKRSELLQLILLTSCLIDCCWDMSQFAYNTIVDSQWKISVTKQAVKYLQKTLVPFFLQSMLWWCFSEGQRRLWSENVIFSNNFPSPKLRTSGLDSRVILVEFIPSYSVKFDGVP